MDRMVELDRVTKDFGDVRAVREVTLGVPQGAFMTVLGPSGCGKTTLLRMIAGFETPSAGEIRIHGERVDKVPPYRRSIGMVFQRLALFPHMTAAQNIAYPLRMRRFEPSGIAARVRHYLDLVRLGGLGDRRPHELSGGQQQRVAIARALVFSPDLLLLDEPLSALDRKLREDMQIEFRRIQQELNVTTINVTHDQREALVMSDVIAVMKDGVIRQAGPPVELYRRPLDAFVATFIGVTSMLDAVVAGEEADNLVVRAGDRVLRASANGRVFAKGDAVRCAIRAEQIRILEAGEASPGNRVDGLVRQRIFEGERTVYEIECPALGGLRLKVFDHDAATHSLHPIGLPVEIGWQARDLIAFPRTQPSSDQEEGNDLDVHQAFA